MSDLRPGFHIEVIFESDYLKSLDSDYLRSNLHFYNALVYDVDAHTIIISETSPPLKTEHRRKTVVVTYLVTDQDKVERYGLSAEIADFLTDYRIDSPQPVQAVALKRKSSPREMNVRLHFRISPTFGTDLALYYGSTRLNIVDISLGGAQFHHVDTLPLREGRKIRLRLEVDQKAYELEASVIRVWRSSISDRSLEHHFAAVKFLPCNRELEQRLSSKIMNLQRELMLSAKGHA
jgi:hypothetical protein